MEFKRLQDKLKSLPNNSVRLQQLQYEYEALISKISEYYQINKRLIDLQKKKLANNYENFEFMQQYEFIQQKLQQQRRDWKYLVQQYTV